MKVAGSDFGKVHLAKDLFFWQYIIREKFLKVL